MEPIIRKGVKNAPGNRDFVNREDPVATSFWKVG